MAFSINTYTQTEENNTEFAVNFALGYLSQSDVYVWVTGEEDGQGDQIYRTFDWVTDSLIDITDGAPIVGATVNVQRIMDKTVLENVYEDGDILVEENLDQSFKQTIMIAQEVLDGFGLESVQSDINMNGHSITNVAVDENDPNSLATVSFLGTYRDDAQAAATTATTQAGIATGAASTATTQATIAQGYANSAAISAGAASTSEGNASTSETNAAASASAASVDADRAENAADNAQPRYLWDGGGNQILTGNTTNVTVENSGSTSYRMVNTGNGAVGLFVDGTTYGFNAAQMNPSGNGWEKNWIMCRRDAGVQLFYNDSVRVESTDIGATVTGELQVFDTATSDPVNISVSNSEGSVNLQSDAGQVRLRASTTSGDDNIANTGNILTGTAGGSTRLYFGGNLVLSTTGSGIAVANAGEFGGSIQCLSTNANGISYRLRNSEGGSRWYQDGSVTNFQTETGAGTGSYENHIVCTRNAGTSLYYNGDIQLTTGTGTQGNGVQVHNRLSVGTGLNTSSADFFVWTGEVALGVYSNGVVRSTSTYGSTTAASGNVHISSSGDLFRSTSSERYKENITDYVVDSDTIDSLRPVLFNSINEDDDELYAGFISEEVAAAGIFEHFVERNADGEEEGIHYAPMVAYLTGVIQDERTKRLALEARIEALENA